MPARSAGQVQHRIGLVLAEHLAHKVDMGFGFTLVPMRIELEILGAKPLFVPGHGRNDIGLEGRASGSVDRIGGLC